MYKISDEVKQLILNIGNGVYVNYILTFPELDLTITNDTLYQESIKIIQSLFEDEELTLGGCIASSMTFEVAEIIDKDINNCKFSAGIQLVDSDGKQLADTIPMGVFTVTNAKSADDKDYKDVTAFDDMYYKASVDVAEWYNNYFPIVGTTTGTDSDGNTITTNVYGKTTLGQFRKDLLEHLGISYMLQDLPDDDMVVEKTVRLIWENDIVNTQCGKAIVVWDKAEWRIKWIKDAIWRKDLHFWTNEDDWKCEVIGNIFDNPELLESEG